MNKKQLAEAIAKAEEELARLKAITPEPEVPLMVLSADRNASLGKAYYWVSGEMQAVRAHDTSGIIDSRLWNCGNRMESAAQANAYARAFRTLLLIRRQPGIVAAQSNSGMKYRPIGECIEGFSSVTPAYCMFPCFESLEAAQAAIKAVGEDELVFCSNFLGGNITEYEG